MEIKEFKPSTVEKQKPFDTAQGKPKEPAEIVSNEEFEKRRREISARREELKTPGQRKDDARKSFIDKIRELKDRFKKIEEDNL